jgi:hypothetical protein
MEEKTKLDSLANHIKQYAEESFNLLLINLYEKVSRMISGATAAIIFAVFGIIVLLFASIGLAMWVGSMLESTFAGFFIVAGFYLLVAAVLYMVRDKFIRLPVVNSVIKSIYYAEEED